MKQARFVIALLSLAAASGVARGTVGPVVPCPEGVELCEPVPEEQKLPKRWGFWSACETFVGAPTVEFVITADGQTSEHRIVRSSGCVVADEGLLCWLKKWEYQPARCGGDPVAYRTTFTINWHPGSGEGELEVCPEEDPAKVEDAEGRSKDQ